MKNIIVKDLWLLILIIGLPLLAEVMYSPALPNIARSLLTSNAMVEYTLTIYFLGFALGTLCWGKLSDLYGRKPALISGILVYLFGCLGCFLSTSIMHLMVFRCILGFGSSSGNVLGHAICRDLFKGKVLGQALSIIGSTLSVYVVVGPMLGAYLNQSLGWPAIFMSLVAVGLATLVPVMIRLQETHVHAASSDSIKVIILKMLGDKKVLAYGFLAGASNGIGSSFYAGGPFYLVTFLGLSPSWYGSSYVLFAFSGLLGGYLSKKLHDVEISSFNILMKGNAIIFYAAAQFLILTIIFNFLNLGNRCFISLTLVSMTIIMTGVAMMTPNVVSLALEDYKSSIGTASSLFSFYYYLLIASFTFILGCLHTNTLFSLPVYFLGIAISMVMVGTFLATRRFA